MAEEKSVAVVTGSAGGIGHAVVTALLESDSRISCAAVDWTAGHAKDLVARYGGRVLEVTCDVSDLDRVQAGVERIVSWGTEISTLINAAGIQFACESLHLAPADWRRVLDVNLSGTFFFCQTVGRHMAKGDGGVIVNISSVASYFGFPQRAPYAASKAAVDSLTRTLATEWSVHGIRVVGVAPGYIETPLAREAIDSGRLEEGMAYALHALDRFGTVEEIANVVLFLVSPEASFITGETVKVDGGFSARKVN